MLGELFLFGGETNAYRIFMRRKRFGKQSLGSFKGAGTTTLSYITFATQNNSCEVTCSLVGDIGQPSHRSSIFSQKNTWKTREYSVLFCDGTSPLLPSSPHYAWPSAVEFRVSYTLGIWVVRMGCSLNWLSIVFHCAWGGL